MDNLPLVSYIVPVYNVEKYLERCLSSLLNQTYSHMEIILVDDGSTDNSGSLCDAFADQYSHISVYHQANQGASFARKWGLEKAKGEYVAFVDSDDTIDVRITELLIQAILTYHTEIAVCDYQKGIDGKTDFRDITDTRISTVELEYQRLMQRFFSYDFWGFWGKIYQKDIFENIYFPKATLCEDYAVMAQLFTRYRKVAYVAAPLYHYRVHLGGLSTSVLNERKFEELQNMAYVYQYMRKNDRSYQGVAFAEYISAGIKLLGLIYKEERQQEFQHHVSAIKRLFTQNFFRIITNPVLYWKLKIMLLLLITSPQLAIKISRK